MDYIDAYGGDTTDGDVYSHAGSLFSGRESADSPTEDQPSPDTNMDADNWELFPVENAPSRELNEEVMDVDVSSQDGSLFAGIGNATDDHLLHGSCMDEDIREHSPLDVVPQPLHVVFSDHAPCPYINDDWDIPSDRETLPHTALHHSSHHPHWDNSEDDTQSNAPGRREQVRSIRRYSAPRGGSDDDDANVFNPFVNNVPNEDDIPYIRTRNESPIALNEEIVDTLSLDSYVRRSKFLHEADNNVDFCKFVLNGLDDGRQIQVDPIRNAMDHNHVVNVARDYDSLLGLIDELHLDAAITISPLCKIEDTLRKNIHIKHSFINGHVRMTLTV